MRHGEPFQGFLIASQRKFDIRVPRGFVPRTSVVVPRLIAGILAVFPTALVFMNIQGLCRNGFDPFAAFLGATLAVVAVFLWWYALKGFRPETRKQMLFGLRCGLVIGLIGFVGGFVGPLIFKPDANQGPLLGIFVTGPLGFLLGTVGGWVYARFLKADQ